MIQTILLVLKSGQVKSVLRIFFIVMINHDSILTWLEIGDNYSVLLLSNEEGGGDPLLLLVESSAL